MRYMIMPNVKILRSADDSGSGRASSLWSSAVLLIPEGTEGARSGKLTVGELVEGDRIEGMGAVYLLKQEHPKVADSFYAAPFKSLSDKGLYFSGHFLWSDNPRFAYICGYPIPIHD